LTEWSQQEMGENGFSSTKTEGSVRGENLTDWTTVASSLGHYIFHGAARGGVIGEVTESDGGSWATTDRQIKKKIRNEGIQPHQPEVH